jgi:hypothetical protein
MDGWMAMMINSSRFNSRFFSSGFDSVRCLDAGLCMNFLVEG